MMRKSPSNKKYLIKPVEKFANWSNELKVQNKLKLLKKNITVNFHHSFKNSFTPMIKNEEYNDNWPEKLSLLHNNQI